VKKRRTLIRRLFSRRVYAGEDHTDHAVLTAASGVDHTDFQALVANAGREVKPEYKRLICEQLRRWGIPDACVSVEVISLGPSVSGRESFVGLLRLTTWHRKGALRLLLGLPILERKVRELVSTVWVAEVSDFGGLWLHAAGELQGNAATSELRSLLVSLTGARAQAHLRANGTRPAPL
jgi:hypothetical protein